MSKQKPNALLVWMRAYICKHSIF